METMDTDAYLRMAENLEAGWQDALKIFRCVECARLDLMQRLRLMARAAEWEIIGPQGEAGDPVPEERNGIRRTCPTCQTPPPGSAIRFFLHGPDELRSSLFPRMVESSPAESWDGRRYPPYAFTEQGVATLSNVRRSQQAVQVNIVIMDLQEGSGDFT